MVAVGNAFTVTIALPDCVWLQANEPDEATFTKAYVAVPVKAGVVIVAVPEPFKVMVWLLPEFTVYVTTAFGVPVNVMVAVPFGQTEVVPEMATVGNAVTLITAEPVCV